MTPAEYFNRVRRSLKGFLPEHQDLILEELASHIEAGQQDETRGEEPGDRQARILDEMGTPAQMGSGFHAVYRPNRWMDFLLTLLAAQIAPLLIQLVMVLINPIAWQEDQTYVTWSLRTLVLVGMLMTFIAYQRRSTLMIAFWVSDVIARLISLMTREQAWLLSGSAGAVVNLLGYFTLVGLGVLLARFLARHRHDGLIVLFALQPLIGTLIGLIGYFYLLQRGLSPTYPDWWRWNLGGVGMITWAQILSLAGVFLLTQRDLRWLAFFIGIASSVSLLAVGYRYYIGLSLLWVGEIVLVVLVWALDWRKRRKNSGLAYPMRLQ